jgi:hypothetical protein
MKMDIDIIDSPSPTLNNDGVGSLIVDPVSLMEAGMSLQAALSLVGDQSGASLGTIAEAAGQVQAGDSVDLLASGFLLLDPDVVGDSGGGYVQVSLEPMYPPDGFVPEDLYAMEFIHNASTGELTILLHFSKDPLDHSDGAGVLAGDTVEPLFGGIRQDFDFNPETNQAPSVYPKCTVTKTVSTTQHSGSYTVQVDTLLFKGSRTSPSESTTTTYTVTVDGYVINGRCVVKARAH